MGIYGAMLTAVSGLRAQSYSLENISGNIANSQTTGFKRVDTNFVDLIPEMAARQEKAGSVGAYSRLTNTLQGDLQPTGVPTNMALNGEGFFVVQKRSGYVNNQPLFEGSDLYTRRGDFTVDKDGYLVNGAGDYLKGTSIDPVTGEVVGSGNGIIRLSNTPIEGRPTSEIVYSATLPTKPATSAATPDRANSELLVIPAAGADPGLNPFQNDPRSTGDGFVRGDDQTIFVNRSISGGSITIYNDAGSPLDVQLRWAKTSNTAGAETWELYYLANSGATGADPAWRSLGQAGFDASGRQTSGTTLTLPATATVNGVAVGGAVDIAFGTTGLRQYSSSTGYMTANTLQQDGYPPGTLESIGVTSDGRISGSYSNGRVLPLATVSVAQFNADNALKRLDGGAYAQTLESGSPLMGMNGSAIIGGTVEQSNTDIAEEFSKMIVTQQAYSANTRVVTTSQQMLQDVLNMVR
jgi:flagellar hook protein FlgE